MGLFIQTFNAKINYTDANGMLEKCEPVILMVKAENKEEARDKFFKITKNAYLTWGDGSEIIKAKD